VKSLSYRHKISGQEKHKQLKLHLLRDSPRKRCGLLYSSCTHMAQLWDKLFKHYTLQC